MAETDKSDTIIRQTDALQVLPMTSDTNVCPAILDTDSYLQAPKDKDSHPTDNGNKDESLVTDDGTTTNEKHGHVRRFSTGNIAIPYTKVKILSRYLASSPGASCHDYCKYGMRKEGDNQEETNHHHHHHHSSTLMKRFNDALGKGHQMFKHTTSLIERRKKRSIHVLPTKTAPLSFDSPKKMDSPSRISKRGAASTNSKAVHSPRRSNSDVSRNNNGGGGVRSRLNSSSSSALAVIGTSPKLESKLNSSSASALAVVGTSPKLESKRDVTPFAKSRLTLSKLGASYGSELGFDASPNYEKSRRSKSVPRVETSSSSSSSAPQFDRLPILSKIYSSSPKIVSEVGVSSPLINPKFQRIEAFISPIHRRRGSMTKLSISSSVKEVEGLNSKTSPGSKKSPLPRSLSSKEDNTKEHRSKKQEALVLSPVGGLRKSKSSIVRIEQKSSGDEQQKLAGKETVTSPARHKFLRRQSISEPLRSPPLKKKLTTRTENIKPVISHLKEVHQPNNVKKVVEESEKTKEQKGPEEKKTIVNVAKTVKAANATEKRTQLASPTKHEANKSITKSKSSTRKLFKRAKNVCQTPLFHEKYKILRRTGARSVASEPMGESNDCLSVISSTDSCETDHVLEQKAMERVLASRFGTSTRGTRRRAFNIGGHKDEQPRKLKFRPGRVIEFKSEINSPRRLKFKRRSVPRKGGSPQSSVGMMFGVLRKTGGRRESNNHRVQFAADVDAAAVAEKVVLRHQEMHQEKGSQAPLNNVIEEAASKLVEDRRSKVKALVGAFESLMTLQDSKPTSTVSA
ncbi:hypothetical protein LINPERHAP1_LOCUS35861 [Linum perenne]